MLADPKTTVEQLALIVEQDIALSVKLLQMVNSSFYGAARRITSVKQAVSFVGTQNLRNSVLSAEIFKGFDTHSGGLINHGMLQKHSTLTAHIARLCMDDRVLRDDAYLAGLVHDIGKLVLAQGMPKKYSEVIKFAAQSKRPLYEVEKDILGVSHAEVGAYLMGIWGLPNVIVEAAAFHHEPKRAPHSQFDVLDAVSVANFLVHELRPDLSISPSVGYVEALPDFAIVTEKMPIWREQATELVASFEEDLQP